MREQFYSLDQGSRIIPLSWLMALKLPDGRDFLHDNLARYGYLPADKGLYRLPIGFTAAGPFGEEMVGMTCAACHTRQISAGGRTFRVDGGPAFADFQAFVADLDTAVRRVIDDPHAYKAFVRDVLGPNVGTATEDKLRWSLSQWYYRFHTLMEGSLPRNVKWGAGRLDAVAMIFNRLTGLDLGPAPHFIIADNIVPATAPVRYPFLWNTHRQEVVQWTGIADNKTPLRVLARNVGQALGVFAEFVPKKSLQPNGDYVFDLFAVNSIQFGNLKKLEKLMWAIGPPKWPWPVDQELAERGARIFGVACAGCHGAREVGGFWETNVYVVGTDRSAVRLLLRDVDTGVFADAGFARREPAAKVLQLTAGALAASSEQRDDSRMQILAGPSQLRTLEVNLQLLRTNTPPPPDAAGPRQRQPGGYVARVLHGVWAAAPFLHNGSVPTLRDLLKPPDERPAEFAVGADYDPVAVGLAAKQSGRATTMTTTGCHDLDSGNSRCGHAFGTELSPSERDALIEYLKTL
ncbi:MAG: hypothetical protein KDJ37_01955 [Hyphomicrobiaceae bacterium]|nr:hypothetical protein [Hyphomicrobiaceae bacterium]